MKEGINARHYNIIVPRTGSKDLGLVLCSAGATCPFMHLKSSEGLE